MFGDPIQRVYGFIGAMEGLKTRATTDLCLSQLELEHNHRFSGGSIVGELGAAIRSNMKGVIAGGTPRLPIFVGAVGSAQRCGVRGGACPASSLS